MDKPGGYEGGWVKQHRAIMDHAVWADAFLFQLFSWCVMKAAWKKSNSQGDTGNVGTFITGRNKAAEELHVSPSKWYRGINALAQPPYECIALEVNSNWTRITVCNYETYQSADAKNEQQVNSKRTANEQQVNSKRTANEQQVNTIEESNNPRREEGNTFPSEEYCNEAATQPALPPLLERERITKEQEPKRDPATRDQHVYPVFGCVAGKTNVAVTWQLPSEQIAEWQQVFPGVDVHAACLKAHAWVRANWGKRKTASGMPEFLWRWIAKEQNQAGAVGRFANARPAKDYTPLILED